ncbi:unnamed protein product [Tuber melanosporum]|uniref:(Perigord truffle) hypothetical protein n=1 Tax=Tuber melanosporum (strain Mel28) TaxID=656061 RepID=D5G5B1_TUBMM|nr:uncharacterized protein GSTUM_00004254001 [Tuber melanosporum]CAZ79704.1 unnamed protein product [Tuber melanosporum]
MHEQLCYCRRCSRGQKRLEELLLGPSLRPGLGLSLKQPFFSGLLAPVISKKYPITGRRGGVSVNLWSKRAENLGWQFRDYIDQLINSDTWKNKNQYYRGWKPEPVATSAFFPPAMRFRDSEELPGAARNPMGLLWSVVGPILRFLHFLSILLLLVR